MQVLSIIDNIDDSLLGRASVSTPLGSMVVEWGTGAAGDRALTRLSFEIPADRGMPGPALESATDPTEDPFVDSVASWLEAYFAGDRSEIPVPLAPKGTAFQRAVWESLLEIPYGSTVSYGQLAERLGKPTGARAVGSANGRNPIAIAIPCHRVIAADGGLQGYAYGRAIKAELLRLEGARLC